MSKFYMPSGHPSFAQHMFAVCDIYHLARVIATIEGIEIPGLIVFREYMESHGPVGIAIMYGPLLEQFMGKKNSPVRPVEASDYGDIPDIEQLDLAMPIVKEMGVPYVNYNGINTHLLNVSFQRVATPLFYFEDEGELPFFKGRFKR
jgi:hypothetical protein